MKQVAHTSSVLKLIRPSKSNLPMGTNGASLAFRISLDPWSSSYEEREISVSLDIVIEESSDNFKTFQVPTGFSKHYALSFKKKNLLFWQGEKNLSWKKKFFFFKVSRKWIPHSDSLTHTLCLWHGHRHHGGGGTPRQTHGCSLPRSVRAWNAGPLNLCNSHSEGCKVALLTHTHTNTKRTLVFI